MNDRDLALAQELIDDHPELGRLMQQHADLELRLDALGKLVYLTPDEALEQRQLKKQKLAGRDRIEQILAEYR